MNDSDIANHIEELVAEEHELLNSSSATEGLSEDQHARLRFVKEQLDRYWDLLRQRRAHEEFGLDPDEASIRSAGTVGDYRQ
jgi:hypothetical protein